MSTPKERANRCGWVLRNFDDIPNLTKVLFKLDSNAEECMGEKASDYFKSEKGKNRLDNLNLLYVAFTRAIQRLYVLAPKGKIAKNGERQENIIMDFLSDKETHLIEEKGSLKARCPSSPTPPRKRSIPPAARIAFS